MDVVCLPEYAVTAGIKGKAFERAMFFEGKIKETFSSLAKKFKSYIIVPMDLIGR